MDKKLILLAIHTQSKALILKDSLENEGITVILEKKDNDISKIYVKIKESDLSKALTIIESSQILSYNDKHIQKIDDGKKRLLVAVDFSDYSIKACHMAFNIAKTLDAKVKILHVYNNMYFPSHIPFADTLKIPNNESMLDKARKNILNLCCDIDNKIETGEFPSVNYSYSLREGIIEDEVETFIKEYEPTLLVVGTKGSDNNNEYAMGSVAAGLIEATNIPVMAVPTKAPLNNIKEINHLVFLTNLLDRDETSFDNLVNFLKPLGTFKLTLLHINLLNKKGDKWTDSELSQIKEAFEERYPEINVEYKLIDGDNLPEITTQYIESSDVDMVIINTRRRNIFARMFAPASMSRRILAQSDKIILLVMRG